MVHPTDLHLAIVRNNPEAVRLNLERYGVRTQTGMTAEQLLDLAYRLEGSCFSDFLEQLSDILAVPNDPNGVPIDENLVSEEEIKHCLVLVNGLQNAPAEHSVIPTAQVAGYQYNYKVFLGIIVILLVLIALLLIRSNAQLLPKP